MVKAKTYWYDNMILAKKPEFLTNLPVDLLLTWSDQKYPVTKTVEVTKYLL